MTAFDPDQLINQLRTTPRAIRALIDRTPPERARWKPDADHWSILEIVNHLADEESRDFRPRFRSTLESPTKEWEPIDPPAWVIDEAYNTRDLAESLARFEAARTESLAWLDSSANPAWDNTYAHPSIGSISAGDLLAAWAAHDLLHLRQLTKRCFQSIELAAGEFNVGYAGQWTK